MPKSATSSRPSTSPDSSSQPGRRRLAQADREALITLACYAAFFLWWYFWAYGPGDADPSEYTYVFGLPAWFFYSCVVGYPLITLLLWLVIRLFFRDMPLDGTDGDDGLQMVGAFNPANPIPANPGPASEPDCDPSRESKKSATGGPS